MKNNNRVTQAQIDKLMRTAEITVETKHGKMTIVTVKLENGFLMTESSACVDPENYDEKIGKDICLEHIKNRLWELEGYFLQKYVYERRKQESTIYVHNFGWAITEMYQGAKMRRRGWNGKGIHIEMQKPDDHSKMTQPYIYIETTNLQSDNPDAPRGRVPWFPSQTDMLAIDWEIAEEE